MEKQVTVLGLGTMGGVMAANLLKAGFQVTTADPHEANEAHIQDLPRLRFRFDRRSLGRLRQLIDLLNREIE